MFQSETCPVLDILFYDVATTGKKNNNWTTTGINFSQVTYTETVTDNGTVCDYSSSGGEVNLLRLANQLISGDFELQITVKNQNSTSTLRLYLKKDEYVTRFRITNEDFTDYKITRQGNDITCYKKVNGNWATVSPENNTLTSEDCYFGFQFYTTSAQSKQLTFKDLKIYPI